MLNLDKNNPVRYTPEQQLAIDSLLASRDTKTGKEMWEEKGPNCIFDDIKQDIRIHALSVQRIRCVYCETQLVYGGQQIDHFADKKRYPQFLYEPLNLVLSCPVCNGLSIKGTKDTIDGLPNPDYKRNSFKYVHPYLDDVTEEIKFRDPLHIFLDYNHCSRKGKDTVDLFHLNTTTARKKRFSNLLTFSTKTSRRKMISEILNLSE